MIKFLKVSFIFLVVFIILGVVALHLFFNRSIKKGIESIGPKITLTSMLLDKVKISPITGYGEIQGFVIGNPEGFHSPSAFKFEKVLVDIKPISLFSECLIIEKIEILGPEVTYEAGFGGSNIKQIQKNIESFAGITKQDKSTEKIPSNDQEQGKKIQLDDFLFQDGTVNLSTNIVQGATKSIPLPEIHLSGIGKKSGGSTISEASKEVFIAIAISILDSVQHSSEWNNILGGSAKKFGETVKENASKLIGGVKKLFDKNKEEE